MARSMAYPEFLICKTIRILPSAQRTDRDEESYRVRPANAKSLSPSLPGHDLVLANEEQRRVR
jgi:hypothetical protein